MPRRPRCLPVGIPAHIVQRGNNRQVCFTSDHDMAAYAKWLADGAKKFDLAIHAWVLMSNHVHILATPGDTDTISRCLQYLGRYYVRYFNDEYGRTGTLFEGRFRANLVQSQQYFLACSRYIELNPVRAGMVQDPADYVWSSYAAHAFGRRIEMWSAHDEYLALGNSLNSRQMAYRALFSSQLGTNVVADIRDSLNKGFALGNQRFRDEVEFLTGIRQSYRKRGPKPKLGSTQIGVGVKLERKS